MPVSSSRTLKQREVCAKVGLSRCTIWRLEKSGQFPSRVKLSPGRVGWFEHEVEEWLESRQRLGGGAS